VVAVASPPTARAIWPGIGIPRNATDSLFGAAYRRSLFNDCCGWRIIVMATHVATFWKEAERAGYCENAAYVDRQPSTSEGILISRAVIQRLSSSVPQNWPL
jgi:hypothetical protein